MSKEDVKDYIKLAKSLIGQKAILKGGGGLGNEFFVVEVLDVCKNKESLGVLTHKAKLKVNWNGKTEFDPFIGSWKILPLHPQLEDLPLGHYYLLTDRIVDADSLGMFTPITHAKTVKMLEA